MLQRCGAAAAGFGAEVAAVGNLPMWQGPPSARRIYASERGALWGLQHGGCPGWARHGAVMLPQETPLVLEAAAPLSFSGAGVGYCFLPWRGMLLRLTGRVRFPSELAGSLF